MLAEQEDSAALGNTPKTPPASGAAPPSAFFRVRKLISEPVCHGRRTASRQDYFTGTEVVAWPRAT